MMVYFFSRTVMQSCCSRSTKQPENPDNPDMPLSFSNSNAAKWSAKQSFSGGGNIGESPWYEPFVISASVTAILVWFCVLREENDVDNELGKSLYDRVDGMEKKQLELALKHNIQGVDTVAIKKRLDELSTNS